MKRNMDLVKAIMIKAENDDYGVKIEGYDKNEILFHQKLLIDASFLDGTTHSNSESGRPVVDAVFVKEITWQGYDFLEVLKDDKKFTYLKDIAKKLPLETIKMGIKLAMKELVE